MANTWLRLYHDMPNDPKWRTIAKAAKQTIPVVLAVYVHLLTIASGAVERGVLVNVNSEDLASALDIDSEAVDAVLIAMQGRVLEGDKLSGWDKRQANREDGGAERAKAWREKKKAEANAANGTRTQTNAAERKRTPDKKREEEIQKEQKPSRDKREPQPNPMFAAVKEMIFKYYRSKNEVDPEWGAGEGKQLSELLKANPNAPIEHWHRCLANRYKSVVAHGERPMLWISRLSSYATPLDQFKNPQGVSNGTFKSKSEHTVDSGDEAIAIIRAQQARANCEPAEALRGEASGEAGHGGLPGLRSGSGNLLLAGH